MRIYFFGNQDLAEDNLPFKVVKKLKGQIPEIEFIEVKPNEDLPFESQEKVFIMDTIQGINKVSVFEFEDLDKLSLSPRTSVHDFDLGFQLKYLQKLGKLGKVTILGLPQGKNPDYNLIISSLRKLVAQDIQGS